MKRALILAVAFTIFAAIALPAEATSRRNRFHNHGFHGHSFHGHRFHNHGFHRQFYGHQNFGYGFGGYGFGGGYAAAPQIIIAPPQVVASPQVVAPPMLEVQPANFQQPQAAAQQPDQMQELVARLLAEGRTVEISLGPDGKPIVRVAPGAGQPPIPPGAPPVNEPGVPLYNTPKEVSPPSGPPKKTY